MTLRPFPDLFFFFVPIGYYCRLLVWLAVEWRRYVSAHGLAARVFPHTLGTGGLGVPAGSGPGFRTV